MCSSRFSAASSTFPTSKPAFPRLNLNKPHFDLCFAARRLGLQGGLKFIERELQIHREEAIEGLDGWDAVRLWHQWRGGDEEALDLLLRYNAADVRNLEPLAELLFQQMVARYGPASVGPADRPASDRRSGDPMKKSPRWLGVGRTETGHVRKHEPGRLRRDQ